MPTDFSAHLENLGDARDEAEVLAALAAAVNALEATVEALRTRLDALPGAPTLP